MYPKTGAIALTGHKHYLFNRVKRMLTLENKKLNLMEKTVLILSIVGITAFGFITRETTDNPADVRVAKGKILKAVTVEPKAPIPTVIQKTPAAKQKKLALLPLPKPEIDTVPK